MSRGKMLLSANGKRSAGIFEQVKKFATSPRAWVPASVRPLPVKDMVSPVIPASAADMAP